MKPEAKHVEWEVLPPEEKERRAAVEPLFRWLAIVMDNFMRIPGTKIRFGIDPLLGLIPGLGDTASAFISATALIQAARRGIPRIILARMSVNVLLNELIGIIPGIGDLFSFWFKSNARNYELLKHHTAVGSKPTRGDWWFVGGILTLLFLVVAAGILVTLLVLRGIAGLLIGGH